MHWVDFLTHYDKQISSAVEGVCCILALWVLLPRLLRPRGIQMLEDYPFYRGALAIMCMGLVVSLPIAYLRFANADMPDEISYGWVLKDIGFAGLLLALRSRDFAPLLRPPEIKPRERFQQAAECIRALGTERVLDLADGRLSPEAVEANWRQVKGFD